MPRLRILGPQAMAIEVDGISCSPDASGCSCATTSDGFYEDWFVKTLTQLGRRALVSLHQQPS